MKYWPPSHRLLLALLVSAGLSSAALAADDSSTPTVNPMPTDSGPSATPPLAKPVMTEPSANASGDTTPTAPQPIDAANPSTYTVAAGDTLWDLSHKFHTSVKKLKKLNHLTKNNLKPGQVLKIPASSSAEVPPKKTTSAARHSRTKLIAFHNPPPARHAEPVQDFDIPASTFASCPVPIPADSETSEPAPTPLPVADSKVSPSAEIADSTPAPLPETTEAKTIRAHALPLAPEVRPVPVPAPYVYSAPISPVPAKPHGFFSFFYTAPAAPDWGTRFTQLARELGDRGLTYNADWCPPGEEHSWSMDCSNTTRYLYKVATGIQLPRTASDQYYYLHLQNKAWDVPQTSTGFADCNYLRSNLKPGDLLFWENTYRPERQPPITHVMVFLGTNDRGNWIMAGSQSGSGGEHNRRHGGPDIYVFNPTKPCGGYSTWMGLVHHQGRFCAFGRPLEADKSKLAVAAND
jgi:LysM repeat protein